MSGPVRVLACWTLGLLLWLPGGASAAGQAGLAPGEGLRYRWQAGANLILDVSEAKEVGLHSDVYEAVTVRLLRRQVERWRVTRVDADGTAELEISIMYLASEFKVGDGPAHRLNSAILGEGSPGRALVERSAAEPQRAVISATGEVLSVTGGPNAVQRAEAMVEPLTAGVVETIPQGEWAVLPLEEGPEDKLRLILPAYPEPATAASWDSQIIRSAAAGPVAVKATYRRDAATGEDAPLRITGALRASPIDGDPIWDTRGLEEPTVEGEVSYTVDPQIGVPSQIAVDSTISGTMVETVGNITQRVGHAWQRRRMRATMTAPTFRTIEDSRPPYELAWTTWLPQPGADHLFTHSIAVGLDGRLITASRGRSAGGYETLVDALDAAGRPLWAHTITRQARYAFPVALIESDGAATVVTSIAGDDPDESDRTEAFRFDGDGALLGRSVLGTGGFETVRDAIGMKRGGVTVVGVRFEDPDKDWDTWLSRFDSGWRNVWSMTVGSRQVDIPVGAAPAPAGGYVVAGLSYEESGGEFMWLAHYDEAGQDLWNHVFGHSSVLTPAGFAALPGDRFALVANVVPGGPRGVLIVCVDDAGTILWDRFVLARPERHAEAVAVSARGTLLIAGDAMPDDGSDGPVLWTMELDPDGALLRDDLHALGFGTEVSALAATLDGGFVIAFVRRGEPDAERTSSGLLRFVPNVPPSSHEATVLDGALWTDWRHVDQTSAPIWGYLYAHCLNWLAKDFDVATLSPHAACLDQVREDFERFISAEDREAAQVILMGACISSNIGGPIDPSSPHTRDVAEACREETSRVFQ